MIQGRNLRKRKTRWMNCTAKSVVPCNSVGLGFDWVKEAAAHDGRTFLRFSLDLPEKDVQTSPEFAGGYCPALSGGCCNCGRKKSSRRSPSGSGGAFADASANFAAFFESPARR